MPDYKNSKPKTTKTELHITIYSNMTTPEKVYRLCLLTVHHKKQEHFGAPVFCVFLSSCVIEPTRGVRAPNWVRAIASPSPKETSQARRLPVRGFFYRLRPLIDPSAIPQKVQKTNKQRCLQCLPTCAKIQVKSFWRPCS